MFQLKTVAMATAVSQDVRHRGRYLGFFKNIFSTKLIRIFLKLVENMF